MVEAAESVALPAAADPARLETLWQTQLLDSAPEGAFDRIARLAERPLDVPVVLISLVDEDRQFFKSVIGLAESWASRRETPLEYSWPRPSQRRRRGRPAGPGRARPAGPGRAPTGVTASAAATITL